VGINFQRLKGKAFYLFFKLLLCFSFCLTGLPVMASWDGSFIEGLNAHGTDATINFSGGALLYNAPTNGQLPASTVTEADKSCVSDNKAKNCKASSPIAIIPNDRLAFSLCTSTSTEQIGPPTSAAPNVTVEQGEYGNINLSGGSDRTLTFNTENGIYKMKSLTASSGKIVLSSGQYWIETLSINNGVELEFPTTGTVTFFIKNDYQHYNLNLINESERFIIYTYGNFVLNGSALLNAYVFSEGDATISGSASLNGALTASNILLEGNSSVSFGDKVTSVTTTPNCTIDIPPTEFHIQYGKATTNSITFDKKFPTGVSPLVFLMPTVEDSNNDGPASVFIDSVSEQGFIWSKKQPDAPSNRYVASNEMPEVHWIAVTPGTYKLPNDTKLIAGSVDYNQALFGSNSPYTSVTLALSLKQNILLNQIQTQKNNCWLTSSSQFSTTGIELALDTSEVYSNSRCRPDNLNNSQIKNETIGYLVLESGNGTMEINGEETTYHFGQAQTFTDSGTEDIRAQCSYTTPLTGFKGIPTLVAGKNSRLGGDGGWLRRCQLTNDKVSMVVDEDTFSDNDRKHRWENYSFVAFENVEPVFQCFTDDFQRTDLGDDWVVSNSRGSFTPSIVSNRLQVTQAATNQATSSTYQRLFPAADNFVTIEFDHYAYNGSGADGIAFVLSDSTITPQAGAYGGPLGYGARSNEAGFAGGWLGFGIDEYGNFSREGGSGGPGRRKQSVAIRGSGSGTSGYPYLRGTCSNGTTNTSGNCLSPTIDNNNVTPAHRYRITVDSQVANQSLVKVERNTGSGFVEIISAFDAAAIATQAVIPNNFLLSLTGSTGGSTNKHEIDNVNICALKSNPVGIQIDHFEYSYSGQGITCTPKTLSIKACANADCTQTEADTVTATLSPATVTGGGGWVGGNVITFTGGQKSDLQLRRNTPGTVTLGVTGSTPSTKAFSKTLCRVNGSAASEANCGLVFADSGFIFDVPDKLANKPTGNVSISAVKKSDSTLQCVPTFASTTKNVGFWSTYIEPTTLISGQSVTVNATAVGKQSSAATTLALAFDAEGKADIIVNYPDAGRMQLDAKYTGTGDEQGLIMLGSDQFVSFPVGLCVTPKDSVAECSANISSTCNRYKKAGESFDLIMQGKAWQADGDTNYCDNVNTPNYSHTNIVLGHQLVAPAGGVLGAVGSSLYNHAAQTTNSNTVSQSVTEVGVFSFTANPPSSYLGSSFYDIPLAASPNIGRFIPDRFLVSSSSVLPSCGSFTYIDQPFGLTLTLSALNTGTYVTQNYQGAFAKGSASLVGENINNGVDLSGRLSALPINAGSWALGEANVGLSYQANFRRTVAPAVDGPFSQLALGVQAFDNDGAVSFIASPDMRADSSAICADSNTCNAKQLSTQDFRHGRVVMDNTYGPENEILRMPTYAQYWNGSGWITNVSDSCTRVVDLLDGSEIYDPLLTSGETVTRSDGNSAVNVTMNNGQLPLLWQNTGSVAYRGQVTAPLQVEDWLKWYWNWDQVSPTQLYEPRASVYFGRYRGHDKIIYWREVSQ
jgi:MSHA biogenesis protein MshQ